LWGIGIYKTRDSVSQIAHDDMAAWEKIGKECTTNRKSNLFGALVAIVYPSLMFVGAHLANPDVESPTRSPVVYQSFKVSFITGFLSAVLGIYNSFIVGKEGIAEALVSLAPYLLGFISY